MWLVIILQLHISSIMNNISISFKQDCCVEFPLQEMQEHHSLKDTTICLNSKLHYVRKLP